MTDLGEARGKQELFTKQAPQRLKTLREHALVESAVPSNRIEGVTVARSRVATVVFGKSFLHDRNEEEVRGYRNALKLIHEDRPPVSEDIIKTLHALARGEVGDAGRYKKKDSEIERLIEQHQERYHETLEQSSSGWHEGRHDPWPYVNSILSTLREACREFEERLGHTPSRPGAKTQLIETAVKAAAGHFTLTQVERACPGVSRDMIRRVLRQLQKDKRVECLGRGPGAAWRRKGNDLKRG